MTNDADREAAMSQLFNDAHQAALNEAAKRCHFRKQAVGAVESYMSCLASELEAAGYQMCVVKIGDVKGH